MATRICIPIEFRPQGGGFYFLDQFSGYLEKHSWFVTRDLDEEYDVLFTNHWMTPYPSLMRAVRRNPDVRLVQRIDGAAQNYGRNAEADKQQAKVNTIVDLTIFQSNYARYSTRELFPIIGQDGPIIYNPVDLTTFKPEGEAVPLMGQHRIVCVTWSTNPMKGMADIYSVAAQHPEIDFYLCGSFEDAPKQKNLHLTGLLGREELAKTLRSCHALLTFSKNEACPNHVIEALASGLPILYGDSGAMKEVIGDAGLPVTLENFGETFLALMRSRKEFSHKAAERATKMFSPETNLGTYVEVITGALKNATHLPRVWRSTLAWSYPVKQKLGWVR